MTQQLEVGCDFAIKLKPGFRPDRAISSDFLVKFLLFAEGRVSGWRPGDDSGTEGIAGVRQGLVPEYSSHRNQTRRE